MMKANLDEMQPPIFYGSMTVGGRGQVVIPAEARRDMDIAPGTKLIVMGGSPHKNMLILAKAEYVTALMTKITDMVAQFKDKV
jgi:AbrB family looped-hinge helix DNA binding protein